MAEFTTRGLLKSAVKRVLTGLTCGRRARGLVILAYHSVDDSGSHLSISRTRLRSHLVRLKKRGCRGLTAAQFLDRLETSADAAVQRLGGEPERTGGSGDVLLTFDDGYVNFYTDAVPVLNEMGFPATVFVCTDLVGRRPDWYRRDRSAIMQFARGLGLSRKQLSEFDRSMDVVSREPLMSREQILELRDRGMDIGSHTASHAFLDSLSSGQLESEVRDSREALERMLGSSVELLSYPYGTVDERVVSAAARSGYRAGFLSEYNGAITDRYRIGRIGLNGLTTDRDLDFVLSDAYRLYEGLRRLRRVSS